eukprot:m.228858 g.228858  ORF g.228858 m.228858 type:complete len:539 (-) comp11799_c0_seq1:378-1994(-)
MASKTTIIAAVVSVIGALLLIMGLIVEPVTRNHLEMAVPSFSSLQSASSPIFSAWMGDPSQSVRYVTFYFYNVTNPEIVRYFQGTPALAMVGPFTIREILRKTNITWSPDGAEVSYNLEYEYESVVAPCPFNWTSKFHWGSDVICGLPPDSTVITTSNVPLLMVVEHFQNRGWPEDEAMNHFINYINENFGPEDLLLTSNVTSLLFGYNDALFSKVNELIRTCDDKLNDFCYRLKIFEKTQFFSMLRSNEPKDNGLPSSVLTGKNAMQRVGQFTQWRNHTGSVQIWNGTCANVDPATALKFNEQANKLQGGDTILFSPLPAPDTPQVFWSPDLFRAFPLIQTDTDTYHNLNVNVYTADPNFFANSSLVPEHCAFDLDFLPGVQNLTRVYNSPIFLSNPMFSNGDLEYLHNVSGLTNLHGAQTEFWIEPFSGLAVASWTRLQMNARFMPDPMINVLKHIRRGGFFLPVLAGEAYTHLDGDVISALQSTFGDPMTSASNARLAGIITGSFMMAIAVSLLIVVRTRQSTVAAEQMPLLVNV